MHGTLKAGRVIQKLLLSLKAVWGLTGSQLGSKGPQLEDASVNCEILKAQINGPLGGMCALIDKECV